MVTDMECLLDDESRKSIMLLRGLKGTQLVIPMIGKELYHSKFFTRPPTFRSTRHLTNALTWLPAISSSVYSFYVLFISEFMICHSVVLLSSNKYAMLDFTTCNPWIL